MNELPVADKADKIARVVRSILDLRLHILSAIISSAGFTLIGNLISSEELWHGIKLKHWGYGALVFCTTGLIWLTISIALKDRNANERVAEIQRAADEQKIRDNQHLAAKSERISELESENDQLRATFGELVNDQLSLMFYRLSLSQTERVSVYKHDAAASQFLPLGRYAPNPEFKKQRRKTYPDDEGFIMKAWQEGEFIVENLPDPLPKKGKAYYEQVNQHSPIGKEVVDGIRMKSRCFFCKAIRSPDTKNPVAVLIVESLNVNVLDTNRTYALAGSSAGMRGFWSSRVR